MANIVKFKNHLNSHVIEQDIITMLTKLISEIPNIGLLRLDLEITLYAANVVENIVKKINKIDKKALVIGVIANIFNLTVDEQSQIGNQLDFLSANGKIKAVSLLKIIAKKMYAWVEKKVL